MKRKITALCLVVAMLAIAIIGSTMAYFTDTDSAVNVMTMGNVDIEMHEKDRTGKAFSEYNPTTQILPAVYSGTAPKFADNADIYWDGIENSIDKTVTVENKGKSPAYVRTWLAFEVTDGVMHYNFGDTAAANAKLEWLGANSAAGANEWLGSYADRSELAVTVIDGISYYIARYTYLDALAAGDTSSPSLIEFALDKAADNEDVAGIGDNYEILAFTQAIQAAGFTEAAPLSAAEVALSEFGDNHPFSGMTVNHITTITSNKTTAVMKMSNAVTPADIEYGVNKAIEEGATSLVLEGDVSDDQQLTLSNAITSAAQQAASTMMTLRNTPTAELVVVLNETETIIDELQNNPYVAYCFDKTGIIETGTNTYAVANKAGIKTWAGYANKTKTTAVLMADIVLPELKAGETGNWDVIKVFSPETPSTFDGNGHTVYNLTILSESDVGLFDNCTLTIKNITASDATIESDGRTGVIAGRHYGNIENCHVINSKITDSYWAVGGIVGQLNSGNISDCSVTGTTVKSNGGTGGIVGVINETAGTRSVTNCKVENSNITNTGIYGEAYSGGIICGMINISNSTVNVIGCESVNNTSINTSTGEALPFCCAAEEDITLNIG